LSTDLEAHIAQIEQRLAALGAALRDRNAIAIESDALALQRALASSIHRFTAAARQAGGVPLPLRHRLSMISGQVNAQRETIVRASAALDRAMQVLMPADGAATGYAIDGARTRQSTTGAIGA
jgi:hypothetical protein